MCLHVDFKVATFHICYTDISIKAFVLAVKREVTQESLANLGNIESRYGKKITLMRKKKSIDKKIPLTRKDI